MSEPTLRARLAAARRAYRLTGSIEAAAAASQPPTPPRPYTPPRTPLGESVPPAAPPMTFVGVRFVFWPGDQEEYTDG